MPASARQGSNGFLLGVDVHGLPTQEADERQTGGPRQGRPPAMREQEAAARTGMPAQDRTFESERIAGPQVVPKALHRAMFGWY